MAKDPIYLGDGLYAQDRGYDVRVYASNGVRDTDEVFLDAQMLARLNAYVER